MKTAIEMALEVEFEVGFKWCVNFIELERLVELARADEREACAKFCETHQVWVGQGKRGLSEWGEDDFVTGGIHQGMDYAAAIRARSEK